MLVAFLIIIALFMVADMGIVGIGVGGSKRYTRNPLHDPKHPETNGPFGKYPRLSIDSYDMDTWHEVGELPSGKRWGEMGSMKYLIDDQGRPITKGYHDFIDPHGSLAKVGAIRGPVESVDKCD